MRGKRTTTLAALLFAVLCLAAQPMLAQSGDNPGEQLLAAARKGDVAAVRALLDKGVDVNSKSRYGATALSFACDRGNVELVRLLLERGADANVRDTFYNATPIIWAAMKGHAEVVGLLIDKGAQGKEQALMMGAMNGNAEMVKAVLDRGNLSPETLSSALSQAERNQHQAVVELLTAAGAKAGPKPDFKVDEAILKSYEGEYENDRAGKIAFALKEGKLVGQLAGQPPLTLGAFDATTFAVLEVDGISIKFKVEGDKVTGFTLTQSGMTFDFKKVK